MKIYYENSMNFIHGYSHSTTLWFLIIELTDFKLIGSWLRMYSIFTIKVNIIKINEDFNTIVETLILYLQEMYQQIILESLLTSDSRLPTSDSHFCLPASVIRLPLFYK